ncbi:MAG: hypothetical protein O7I42_17635 [Alphaproteobacteria bacterium]|nr:hypothetical protein [Alphaproteobacteria bacterium]
MMSSEPEEFPIESAIVPLVYAFHSLRLTPPCWSCEGHYNRSGGLDVTFSIEPKICPTAKPELKKLRDDSRIIAESLMTGLKAKSRLRVDCIDRVLNPSKPPRVS